MRTREVSIVTALVAILMYRLVMNPMSATLLYMLGTRLLRLDVGHSVVVNFDGEVEDGVLTHRFVPITETSEGEKVHVTYHLVECGAADAEPLVFYHGLAETWRLWKAEMLPFCDTHRVIAVDSEGMGQSYWPWPQVDIPKGRSRTFMAHMNLALLNKLGVDRFNMVVTDYSFWSTLAIVSEHGGKGGRLLRYGKFQSTVGVEDPGRVPQGIQSQSHSRTQLHTGRPQHPHHT